MADREYQKLPGSGIKRKSFLDISRTRARLWMGKDHLLYILSNGYTEDYMRFYYSDIQAVTIRKTVRFMVWNIILSILTLICILLALKFNDSLPATSFYYTVAFFTFLFLAVNLAKGPTCVCHLYTQVSAEELSSLKRLRTAHKALSILTPLIEGRQHKTSSSGIHPADSGQHPGEPA